MATKWKDKDVADCRDKIDDLYDRLAKLEASVKPPAPKKPTKGH